MAGMLRATFDLRKSSTNDGIGDCGRFPLARMAKSVGIIGLHQNSLSRAIADPLDPLRTIFYYIRGNIYETKYC